jgi:hypothetical protein
MISVRRVDRTTPLISLQLVAMISSTSCSEREDLLEPLDQREDLLYSCTILSRSRPVRRWSRMSRIACAWMAAELELAISPSFAASGVWLARISEMISSRCRAPW